MGYGLVIQLDHKYIGGRYGIRHESTAYQA